MPGRPPAPRRAVRLRATGRVQGVGFRWFACEAAREIGVEGWVRNAPDGSVELHVEGEADDVHRMIDTIRRGPSRGHVAELEEHEAEVEGIFGGFRVRH